MFLPYNLCKEEMFMKNFGKESELVEFKKSTSELNEAIVSISSMLNKNGKGTIYFGVKNNGDGIGQQLSDSTLRDISRKISLEIKPTIYPSIYEIENSPGIIRVDFSGNDKPYSAFGRFYIRSFDEDKQMDIKELLKMINRTDSSNALWEKEQADEDLSSVDEDLLKEYINKANECGRIREKYTSKKEVMKKLGLLSNDYLNNAGRILFSRNKPLSLKLAFFATDEKLSFIDINRFEGNLFELASKGQQYIKEHINFEAKISGSKRIEKPEIPLEAIREVVMNSLCHSSFDTTMMNEIYLTPTKVVIFNPGKFPEGYDPIDFAYNQTESILRNPLISKILYYSNDIDTWSTGFRRIFTLCKESGVKYSYSKKNQGFEFVFFRKVKYLDVEDAILNVIRDNPKATSDEISNSIGKSKRTVYLYINRLKESGKVKRMGSAKSGYWEII